MYVYYTGGNFQADYRIGGTLSISTDNLTTALQGSDLTLNSLTTNTLTVDGTTVDLTQFKDVDLSNVKGITRSAGATTPGTGTTTIEGVLSVDGTTGEIYQEDGAFSVDADGNLIAKSVTDGVYDLATIGKNTQDITHDATGTHIEGVTLNKNTVTASNGFAIDSNNRWKSDDLKVGDGTNEVRIKDGGADFVKGNSKTTISGDRIKTGTIESFNGAFTIDKTGRFIGTEVVAGENGEYKLTEIGAATAGIERTGNSKNTYTVIEKTLKVRDGYISNANESFVVNSKGTLKAANGHFQVDRFGNTQIDGDITMAVGATVDGVDVSELSTAATDISDLKNKTQNISWAQPNATSFKGSLSTEGSFSSGNGAVKLRGNWRQEAAIDLRDADNNYATLTATKLATINNVIDDAGNVEGTTVTTTSGADLDTVNDRTKNMTTIGSTTVFNNKVAINGGGISITGDNGATGIWLRTDGTIYSQNGMSTSGDFKTEAGYTLNTVGADLKTLTGNVGNIGGNVAGIHRDAAEGAAYGEGVTSIEGVVSVDGQSGFVNFSTGNGNGVLINSSQGQIIANQVVASSVGANNVATENLTAGNGALRVSENGDILMQNGSGESISMTDGGLNLMSTDNGTGMVTLRDGSVSLMGNGTSTVTVDENGTTFGTVLGSETTNINGGTVTASGDFVTVDENGNEKYTLNTIGDNTQAIQYQDGVTTIGGDTLAVTDEGYVTINNGAFAVGPDGMVAVGNSIQFDGETGVVYANDLKAYNNVYSENYNLEEVGADLDDLTGSVGNIGDNVAGISRNDGDLPYGEGVTTIEGSTSFDANGMNVGNGAVVANTDGSFSAGNGAFAVDTNGNVTANRVTVGNTVVTGSSVTTDYLQANSADIDGVLISGGLVDGVDVSALGGAFDSETGVVGGISREDRLEDIAGLDTTVIEDSLSVNKENINMFGDKGLDFTYGTMDNGKEVVNVSGNLNFMSGADVTFKYSDSKSYSLNDLVKGISDLNDRVDVLERKTQNINSDATHDGNGQTGQGGEVIDNGANTGFDGDVTVGGDVTAVDGNFSGKVTVGGENSTSITGEGITVGDKNGVSIKNDEVRVGGGEDGKGGSYMNDTDVVTGEGNSLNDTANRVGNLEQGVSELSNRVGELEDRIDKVGAMAAAIANLRTMGYDPAAPTEVAVGIGQYRDETGAALGLFHYPNRDFMLSLSVSTSGDEVMGGIGATWKFGRKSPEKVAEIKKAQAEADVRRAEEAKLAKAEEMKQAAKEAKIKAQQERHAKLAAERAAQAEAAK